MFLCSLSRYFIKFCLQRNRSIAIINFRIWCFVLIFIIVSFPYSCPSLEAEIWRRTPSPYIISYRQTHSDIHMYVCKSSGHSWKLCDGRTILVFRMRTKKFLVIRESLVSVILRLLRGIFLIATFLLDMAPQDVINSNLFCCIKWRSFTICNYLKCWGLRSFEILRSVVGTWLPMFRNNQFLLEWLCSLNRILETCSLLSA
jgi:hypothetical protein